MGKKYVSLNSSNNPRKLVPFLENSNTDDNLLEINYFNLQHDVPYVVPLSNGVPFFDPNDPNLYNKYGYPPPWKGFYHGEASIDFNYEYNDSRDKTQFVRIRIGDDKTGKIYLDKIKCTSPSGHVKIVLAKDVGSEKIPLYNPALWDPIINASDAIRKISFVAEKESPVFLTSFNLRFNGYDIAKYDSLEPNCPRITNADILCMDDLIRDYCLKQVYYYKNKYLRCAALEWGSSWNTKYRDCEWTWDNTLTPPQYRAPQWCGRFLRWILEETDPEHFHDLPKYFVFEFFRLQHLCITPYVEANEAGFYRGNFYPDFYPYLGRLIKPGFFVNTPAHITMFIEWVDANGNPTTFDPDAKPQYFRCIGGSQSNQVNQIILKMWRSDTDPGVVDTDIIWVRHDAQGNRIIKPNEKEVGFTDPYLGPMLSVPLRPIIF